MKIQEIYVQSFGTLKERFFRFDEGVNILEGPNESGKSTLAAFIKYVFYFIHTRRKGKHVYMRP